MKDIVSKMESVSKSTQDEYVRSFSAGGGVDELGGKGYRLSELYRAGFSIPTGFVITTKAFTDTLSSAGDSVPKDVRAFEISDRIFDSVLRAYKDTFGSASVVVRSSAVAEDADRESLAGLLTSLLDVDEAGLRSAISTVYRSAFSSDAINYVRKQGLTDDALRVAVVIQRYVDPWISGVCFTAHPVTGEQQYIVEFVQGHNAELVSGRQEPSRIVFDRNLALTEHVGESDPAEIYTAALLPVIENSGRVAEFLGKPQDIEWAIDDTRSLFILQSRPISTAGGSQHHEVNVGEIIAQGVGVSAGIATGPVRLVVSDLTGAEAHDLLDPGDIAVGHALRIEHLPALAQCAGVIAVESSMLSHVAIRMRELGIPSVGGVAHALTLVPEGQTVTIDGTHGGVYRGRGHDPSAHTSPAPTSFDPARMRVTDSVKAGRIIYLPTPDGVVIFLKRPLDTATRAEAVNAIAETLKIHPREVTVDDHLAWESPHAPSAVSMQYDVLEAVRTNPAFANRLAEAQNITQKLDEQALRALVRSVDDEAHALFHQAVRKLNTFKLSHERKTAEQAAKLFDTSKKLAGDFAGIVIIDILGESVIRNRTEALSQNYNVSLVDVFVAGMQLATKRTFDTQISPTLTEADTEEFTKIARYAHALSELKNQRLNVLSVNNYTGMDLIRDFITHNLADLVEQYQW